MREFENKRRVRRLFSSRIFLVFLFIIFIFLVRDVWNIYQKNRDSVNDLNLAKTRLERLTDRQKSLITATSKIKTETGVEAMIRDKLNMVREGEQEAVIVDEALEQGGTNISTKRTFLQKIWDFFSR